MISKLHPRACRRCSSLVAFVGALSPRGRVPQGSKALEYVVCRGSAKILPASDKHSSKMHGNYVASYLAALKQLVPVCEYWDSPKKRALGEVTVACSLQGILGVSQDLGPQYRPQNSRALSILAPQNWTANL